MTSDEAMTSDDRDALVAAIQREAGAARGCPGEVWVTSLIGPVRGRPGAAGVARLRLAWRVEARDTRSTWAERAVGDDECEALRALLARFRVEPLGAGHLPPEPAVTDAPGGAAPAREDARGRRTMKVVRYVCDAPGCAEAAESEAPPYGWAAIGNPREPRAVLCEAHATSVVQTFRSVLEPATRLPGWLGAVAVDPDDPLRCQAPGCDRTMAAGERGWLAVDELAGGDTARELQVLLSAVLCPIHATSILAALRTLDDRAS